MESSKYTKYYEAIRYLESLNNISGSYQKTNLQAHPNPAMYIERMQDFLDQIGNPEKGFKYIHITGTAGKGSVSTIVHTTLTMNKKRVGLFTSPFVTSTIEKIQSGKKYIDPIIFADIVEYLKPYIDTATIHSRHGMPSYFEIIFAIALLYFMKEKCEYVVLEVGLGGRYDATNIIKAPLVTAITNIGLDHTQILGNTREMIAKDKAGIIKEGSLFFTTEEDPKILSILKDECETVKAKYNQCEIEKSDYNKKNNILAGSICLALKIIKHVDDISIPELLPARFEIMDLKPIIIIDGAHNVSKIKSTIYNLSKIKYKKLIAIIAISSDKDWKKMLGDILPLVDILLVTRFGTSGRPCVNPRDIFIFAKSYVSSDKISFYSDPILAFKQAKLTAKKDDVILVAGSFYLAGDIRKLYCSENQILKQRNSKITKNKARV